MVVAVRPFKQTMPSFLHVVVLRLNDDTTDEQINSIVEGLRDLPAQIPEIQTYRAGRDVGIDPAKCHIGIVGRFATPEAYQIYAKHPAHTSLITSLIKPVLAKRAAVQFSRVQLENPPRVQPGAIPPTLTHVVLLRLKEDATMEQRQAILDGLRALPAIIPEIQAYRFGLDVGTDPAKFDISIVADFEGTEPYQAYAKNQAHIDLITEKIKPFLAERVAVQFSAGDVTSIEPDAKRIKEVVP